jgi:hypothetical protein
VYCDNDNDFAERAFLYSQYKCIRICDTMSEELPQPVLTGTLNLLWAVRSGCYRNIRRWLSFKQKGIFHLFSWNLKIQYYVRKRHCQTLCWASLTQFASYFLEFKLNLIDLFTPKSHNLSLTFRFSDQNFLCISHLFHLYCFPLAWRSSILFQVALCMYVRVQQTRITELGNYSHIKMNVFFR